MRGRQANTFQTFKMAANTCARYLDEVFPTTPDWTVPKNFIPRLQELWELIAEMEQAFRTQQAARDDSLAAITRAAQAQRTLRTQLMVVRRAARALEWNVPGLAAKCRVPPMRSRRSAWHNTVQVVLDSAAPHFAALVDEGVPADTLQRIEQADTAFAKAVADGVAARQRRTTATRRLPTLVTRGHQLIATLSVTMRAYHAADPQRAPGVAAWAFATHVRRDPQRAPRRLVPLLLEEGGGEGEASNLAIEWGAVSHRAIDQAG